VTTPVKNGEKGKTLTGFNDAGKLTGRGAAANVHPGEAEEHVDRDLAFGGVPRQDQHARMIADRAEALQ